jgi:hypothetical protein
VKKVMKITTLVCLVMILAVVSSVRADFFENFESYSDHAYLMQSPWGAPTSRAMTVNQSGYNAPGSPSKGAMSNGADWYLSIRATNVTSTTADVVLSLKLRLSNTANALGRHTFGFYGITGALLTWEMDANTLTIAGPGTLPGMLPFVRGPWYEAEVTIDQVAGTYSSKFGLVGGTLDVLEGPKTLPVGFSIGTIFIGGIWCWDEGDPITSAIDDLSVETIIPTCSEAIGQGLGLAGDVDDDCYVDFDDIAELALEWLDCIDPANPGCEKPWETE